MATDLEQRVRDSLDHAAGRFRAPADLRTRVDDRVAADHRRRNRMAAVGGLAAVVVAAALTSAVDDDRQRITAGPRLPQVDAAGESETWFATTDPTFGWRIEHPRTWTVQHFDRQCRIRASGTVVTNLDRPIQFLQLPSGCTTAWDLAGVPAHFVAVEIGRAVGGPAAPPGPRPDTPLPLSLDQAEAAPVPPPAGHAPEPPSRAITVFAAGERYDVRVWMGRDATAEDRERVERIVASIRPAGAHRPRHVTAVSLSWVPPGFTLVQDVEQRQSDAGDRVRMMTWARDDTGGRRTFEVHRRVGNPLDVAVEVATAPGARATTVQGRDAVLADDGGRLSLSWVPHDRVTLSVASVHLSENELRRVAEGVAYRADDDDLSLPGEGAQR